MKRLLYLIPLILVFLVGVVLAADSDLVAAAKKEKERRAKLKQPAKVLTNQDIDKFKEKDKASGNAQTRESTEANNATAKEDETAKKEEKKEPGAWDNEEYWRGKAQEVSSRVEAAQKKVDELQNDVDVLWRAQTGVDDGQQKQLVTSQRTERLNALDQAKQELEAAKQAQQDLEEEARKAGAPPGWVSQ